MNTITLMKNFGLMLSAMALGFSSSAQTIYAEDFDVPEFWAGGSAGSYNAKTYSNSAEPLEDQFSSNEAVRESTNAMTGYAWRLRNSGTPYFMYECGESIVSFSVHLAHWNPSVAMEISLEYSTNSGTSYEPIASFDQNWWIDQGYGEKEFQAFSSGDLNIAPLSGESCIIRIMTDGNERLLIDNFQLLYNNGSAGVQDPQEFSAVTASGNQIDVYFVPNTANDDVVIVFDEDGSFIDPNGTPPLVGESFAGGTLLYQGVESPQAHAGLLPGQTIHYRAWSFDGNTYSSGVTTFAETGGSGTSPNAWINELHYDNDGGDVDEFVELVVEDAGSFDLASFSIFLYNGSNGEFYASETLDNLIVGSTVNGYTFYTWFYPGIQNGSPEGVALAYEDALIDGQFLSYEGTFMGTNGPASGIPATDIGVEEPTSNPVGYSLQLSGSGMNYTHFYWIDPAENTPGELNLLQEMGGFTTWSGQVNNSWHDAGNWDNGVPNSLMNAVVPDVSSGSANFPVITSLAEVNHLLLETGSNLEIEVNGTLTVFGSCSSNCNVIIRSDATGAGSIIEPGGINATTEQYITPDQWHYIASPVAEVNSDVFEGMYLMSWDEPTETWNFIEEMGIPLNTGLNGYGVWSDVPTTLSFTGDLNTGTQSLELFNTPGTSNLENDPSGYNLVGNPYPSSLDWDVEDGEGWIRTSSNVALSIYFWDGVQYASYVKGGPNPGPNGGTNIIPPHQGFYVKCISPDGGSLTVDDGARIHADQLFYKQSPLNTYARLQISGEIFSDELVIHMNENASFGFDPAYDAQKLYGCEEAPQVYSFANDGVKLSINAFPAIENGLSIPLGFRSPSQGQYEITLDEAPGFDSIPVFLEDLYEEDIIDLKTSGTYTFSAEQGEFDDRFVVHFNGNDISSLPSARVITMPTIVQQNGKLIISSEEPMHGYLLISDLWGRVVESYHLAGTRHVEAGLPDEQGWYIVKVITQGGMHTRKLFLQN
jgi:hypothetical protein